MLDKKICISCFQKNEKLWDEENWSNGYVNCPKEEFEIKFKGQKITEDFPYYRLLSAILSQHETDKAPNYCKKQKERNK